jgi:hypothetical protein
MKERQNPDKSIRCNIHQQDDDDANVSVLERFENRDDAEND